MRRIKYFPLLLFLIATILSGCKSIEKIGRTGSAERNFRETVLGRINIRSYPQHLLIDRIDVKIDDGDSYKGKMTVYLDRGNFIFINVKFLGFEILRAMLTTDSIKYINRLNQQYYFESLEKLRDLPLISLELERLQNFMYSGFLIPPTMNSREFIKSFQRTNTSIVNSIKDNSGAIELFYDLDNVKLQRFVISDQLGKLEGGFDLDRTNGELNAILAELSLRKYAVQIDVELKKIENKEYGKTDFVIGKNYKKLEKLF